MRTLQESKFDWPEILRAAGIIIGAAGGFALIVPLVGALAIDPWDTLLVSGHIVYRFLVWVIAWALTFVLGQQMINRVHERIIDDMLVLGAVCAVALLVVKFIVWLVYWPTVGGDRLFLIEPLDVGGALLLVLVAFIAARVNQY